ncbi:MAG: M20/M25/M40 family metallo-hydrolase, partial [Alphaproteobacteria bacterium]|nr:M20/M25/M40 family metallo-hydrolase [Alphaproteobacteria bacterium]
MSDTEALAEAIASRSGFAANLFEAARRASADTEGVTRPAWSEADMAAARLLEREAEQLGLETDWDRAGNLYMTLPGEDRGKKAILSGSHVDSVPRGGNYDGYAGAVAALTVLAGCRDAGITPPADLRAIALHGEESVWFGIAYVGSRLALGTLPLDSLDTLRRADSGETLAAHLRQCGFEPDALRDNPPPLSPENTAAFFELHIEQGPVLINQSVPVAIPTANRGNVRFPYARCLGRYDHSAACPREYRQDTVLAATELIQRLET